MRIRAAGAFCLLALLIFCRVGDARQKGTQLESESVILFGDPYSGVRLNVAGKPVVIPNPDGFIGQGFASLPSLAPEGDRVVWGLTLQANADAVCKSLEAACLMSSQGRQYSFSSLWKSPIVDKRALT